MGLCHVEVLQSVVVERTLETRTRDEARVELAINLFTQSLRSSSLTPRSLPSLCSFRIKLKSQLTCRLVKNVELQGAR
jgi:hypothetical protein